MHKDYKELNINELQLCVKATCNNHKVIETGDLYNKHDDDNIE